MLSAVLAGPRSTMDFTSALAPDRARTRRRHRLRSVVMAGLVLLGTPLVHPAIAQPDSRTIAVSMGSGVGDSFLTIAGRQTKPDWYRVVATIKRTPCRNERFHLAIVASAVGGLLRTSYDATVTTVGVRTLRGRSISCSRSLPRGIGRRLTKMVIYPTYAFRSPSGLQEFWVLGV